MTRYKLVDAPSDDEVTVTGEVPSTHLNMDPHAVTGDVVWDTSDERYLKVTDPWNPYKAAVETFKWTRENLEETEAARTATTVAIDVRESDDPETQLLVAHADTVARNHNLEMAHDYVSGGNLFYVRYAED